MLSCVVTKNRCFVFLFGSLNLSTRASYRAAWRRKLANSCHCRQNFQAFTCLDFDAGAFGLFGWRVFLTSTTQCVKMRIIKKSFVLAACVVAMQIFLFVSQTALVQPHLGETERARILEQFVPTTYDRVLEVGTMILYGALAALGSQVTDFWRNVIVCSMLLWNTAFAALIVYSVQRVIKKRINKLEA